MIKILLSVMLIVIVLISTIICYWAFVINTVFGIITTAELLALCVFGIWGICNI
jgi:hypothetical protein